DGQHIGEVVRYSISDSLKHFDNLTLDETERQIAKLILKEIHERLTFLNDVGLEYLTLNRSSGTLSGGEAQRIRLATQIGSRLSGVLYVLDEPSIGLHQRDNDRLINTLKSMRDMGNTLIVVEHDADTMKAADYLVDIGPKAGVHGGEIVASGTPEEVMANEDAITGQYLSGKEKVVVPAKRSKITKRHVAVESPTRNNLESVEVDVRLAVLTSVGSAAGHCKSSLDHEVLYKGRQTQL